MKSWKYLLVLTIALFTMRIFDVTASYVTSLPRLWGFDVYFGVFAGVAFCYSHRDYLSNDNAALIDKNKDY
jgi:hypothetical protein